MTIQKAFLMMLMAGTLSACKEECLSQGAGKSTDVNSKSASSPSEATSSLCMEQPPVEEPENPPQEEPETPVASYPLLWEASRAEGKAWTAHTFKVIENELANDLLRGSDDVETFCPRYHTLSNSQRVNFWGLLISAITKYESNYNPLSRMQETTMGTDPVTKLPVYSEGLLQLSYQDTQWAKYCEFDWQKDKDLAPKDPKKTILDPYKNLSCGMKIFARQIRNKKNIAVKSGAYWAVIIPGGKYTKLPQIQELTKKMPGCL